MCNPIPAYRYYILLNRMTPLDYYLHIISRKKWIYGYNGRNNYLPLHLCQTQISPALKKHKSQILLHGNQALKNEQNLCQCFIIHLWEDFVSADTEPTTLSGVYLLCGEWNTRGSVGQSTVHISYQLPSKIKTPTRRCWHPPDIWSPHGLQGQYNAGTSSTVLPCQSTHQQNPHH